MKLDIAKAMRELLPTLKRGVNGVAMPEVQPEVEADWNESYAIIYRVYWERGIFDEDHYFDEDQFKLDLEETFRKHFSAEGANVITLHSASKPDPESILQDADNIVIGFYYKSQEIEVYRR